jgi:hypothetical protein
VLIKEGLFICIDKVQRLDKEAPAGCDWTYMIHVVDPSGHLSYCRTEIRSDASLQLMEQDQVLMWVGETRPDKTVPAWCFYIVEPKDMQPLKGVLTKALFEVNHMEMFAAAKKPSGSGSESGQDQEWREA